MIITSWLKSKREGKKHNFGVKRSWEQRTFLNFKKQTPVDIHLDVRNDKNDFGNLTSNVSTSSMSTGDDPGQGFALSEEVSKSNGVKTSTRGGRCLVPCCKVRRWVPSQEDSAGGTCCLMHATDSGWIEKLEMLI